MDKEEKTRIVAGIGFVVLFAIAAVLFTKCTSCDAPTLEDPFDYQRDEATE